MSASATTAHPRPVCDFGTFTVDAEEEVALALIASKQREFEEKIIRTRGFAQLDFEAHYLAPSRWDFALSSKNIVYELDVVIPVPHGIVDRACTRKDVMLEGRLLYNTDSSGRVLVGRHGHGRFVVTAIRELPPASFRMPGDDRPR